MDSLITAAARALASGDALSALNYIALRDDPPALALRGIAMAQLGDLARAKNAAASRGPRLRPAGGRRPRAMRRRRGRDRARLARPQLAGEGPRYGARRTRRHGDSANAAYARYLKTRYLLLIGRLDEAERLLVGFDPSPLPPASRAAHELVVAGIAMRRLRIKAAAAALARGRTRRAAGPHPAAAGRSRKRGPCPRYPRGAADRTRRGATSAA